LITEEERQSVTPATQLDVDLNDMPASACTLPWRDSGENNLSSCLLYFNSKDSAALISRSHFGSITGAHTEEQQVLGFDESRLSIGAGFGLCFDYRQAASLTWLCVRLADACLSLSQKGASSC